MSTIFALSSGSPPAAIAVVRISGADAFTAVARLVRTLPQPRTAALRRLRDPADGALIDQALVLLFPGPNTATGENLAELHLHGGRAVVRRVEAVLVAQPGLRPALPGEFTRRALASGRIDLTEAEGLGDLLAAETEHQRRAALSVAEGGLRRMVEGWQARVLTLAAHIEATLDHADEADVEAEADATDAVSAQAAALAAEIEALCAAPPVERLRDGIRIVLAGPPNVGKSSLLNALAQRDAAIVSDIAGTTRDRIEVPVVRNGIAYVLYDTAGLALATNDPIERIGIDRARDAMAVADVLLWLGDDVPPDGALWLYPRCDVRSDPIGARLAISVVEGHGIAALWREIETRAAGLLPREDMMAVNQRQRALLRECAIALHAAIAQMDLLLIAEYLRLARQSLDRITGHADVEAMLDTLFGRFCIGK